MKPSEVAAFAHDVVLPRLGDGFRIHAKRDLIRMRGPFVQAVLFAIKKSGWLHIIPTFYVVGADPAHEVMFQTMSLPLSGVDDTGRWRVSADTPLDEDLAVRIMSQLERDSPLTYSGELYDSTIRATLVRCCDKVPHWTPGLSLAFWDLLVGASTAKGAIAAGREVFVRRSRFGMGKPPLDFEVALMARFNVLQSRLGSSEGRIACRSEAEAHAERLGLPRIEWPPEWPEA